MTTNARSTVVGVFDERGEADNAVYNLQNAGFAANQIYYSGSGDNPDTDFWHEIKSLFSRDKTTADNTIGNELKGLGLSDDEVHHYENEYNNGRTIVAVNAAGRTENALAIMRENGAQN